MSEINKNSISVVIPMYNSEKSIIRALDSIKSQTAVEYVKEIIVVNDGSNDDSKILIEKYIQQNLQMNIIIINKENEGVSSARNIGMKESRGDWIALLDSDDEWLENKLEIQVDTIVNNPDIDFLGGDIDSIPIKIFNRRITKLYKANLRDLCIKMFPQTSTVIFKRSIYETLGGYDENQSHAEDGNFFMKICTKFNCYYLPIQIVIYDGGKLGFGGSGLSGNLKKMHAGNIKNIKELRSAKHISLTFYIFLRVYYHVKLMRRIIITRKNESKAINQ